MISPTLDIVDCAGCKQEHKQMRFHVLTDMDIAQDAGWFKLNPHYTHYYLCYTSGKIIFMAWNRPTMETKER